MNSLRTGILTISDRSARGERADLSGPALQHEVEVLGWQVVVSAILPDEFSEIRDQLVAWADSGKVDVILTTGGTGFAACDVTPEATLAAIERGARPAWRKRCEPPVYRSRRTPCFHEQSPGFANAP